MKNLHAQFVSIKFINLLTCLAFVPVVIICFGIDNNAYGPVATIIAELLILLFTVLLAVMFMKLPKYLFVPILLLLTFGLRLAWILNIHALNVSDFEIMYESAVRAAKGDFGFTTQGIYFTRFPYQLGFAMYEALIIFLFGDNTFLLKLFNIAFSTGTAYLVYLIAARLFNELCGRIAGILYALLIPSIALTSVYTNQHLADFLFYLSFYLLIVFFDEKKYSWIAIGVTLSFGDIFRPMGAFLLAAVGVYVLIACVFQAPREKKIRSIGKFAGILVSFYLVHTLVSFLLISSGVTHYSLKNNDPLWKFVTGLNQETVGVFSNKDSNYVSKFKLGHDRDTASMALIKARIADKAALWTLFQKKFVYMWTKDDGSLIWGLRSKTDEYNNLHINLKIADRFMYFSMAFFVFIGLLKTVFDRKINPKLSLIFLLILSYMAIHLVIEIQTRYRYFILPSFIILQSYGVHAIYSWIRKGMFRSERNSG